VNGVALKGYILTANIYSLRLSMAKRKRSRKSRRSRSRSAYSSCLSRALKHKTGCKKGVKGGRKKCQRRRMKTAVNKCKRYR
jgi:hypothetical protein